MHHSAERLHPRAQSQLSLHQLCRKLCFPGWHRAEYWKGSREGRPRATWDASPVDIPVCVISLICEAGFPGMSTWTEPQVSQAESLNLAALEGAQTREIKQEAPPILAFQDGKKTREQMCGASKSMANVCVSEFIARLIDKFSPGTAWRRGRRHGPVSKVALPPSLTP